MFRLPVGQPLVLTFVDAKDRKPILPPVPSTWQMDGQSLVGYDDGQLSYRTRLRLSTDLGTGLTANLILPAAANVLSVTGEDLERWHVGPADATGKRHVEVAWKTPDTLRRELLLTYAVPQPTADGDWRLYTPQVDSDGGRLSGAMYLLPTISLERNLPRVMEAIHCRRRIYVNFRIGWQTMSRTAALR